MSDCIFCKIVEKEIAGNIAYEDDRILAFHDMDPQGPVHVLIVPKKHITSPDDLSDDDQSLAGYILCLTVTNIFIGLISGSYALISEGAHSVDRKSVV